MRERLPPGRKFVLAMYRKQFYWKCFFLTAFTIVFCFVSLRKYIPVKIQRPSGPLFCYTQPQVEEDVLELSRYPVRPNSIFFLETSCNHASGLRLTPRQACAYESAARAHPSSEVLVLVPSSFSMQRVPRWINRVLKYRNVKILHVSFEQFLRKTPLQGFDFLARVNASDYPAAHAADVLRLVTLWKYGGTYLDSDFVIIRSVFEIKNFVAAQSEQLISNGVMNFNDDGKPIVEAALNDLRNNFSVAQWGAIGPEVMTRVVHKICNEIDLSKITPEKCSGLTVYPPPTNSPFLPLYWKDWELLFNQSADEVPELMERITNGIGVHVYSRFSSGTPAKEGTPYSILASVYCPEVFATVDGPF